MLLETFKNMVWRDSPADKRLFNQEKFLVRFLDCAYLSLKPIYLRYVIYGAYMLSSTLFTRQLNVSFRLTLIVILLS